MPVAAGLLTFGFHPALGRMERTVNVFDAFGLALFCVTGALKALEYGLGPLPAALMGMVTGIGGGMLRDLLAGRVPVVFRGELYATPALAGAAIAVVGIRQDLPDRRSSPSRARGVCLVWRLLAMWRGLAGADAHRPGQRLSLTSPEHPAQVGVGEDPVRVEPVAHREEVAEARVRRRPGRRRSRVCTLPQCGRPSWARMIGSIARSTPCGRRRGGCGRRGRGSRGPCAVDSGMSSAGATRISTGKLIRQSEASIARRASRSAVEPGLARDGVLHLPEDHASRRR